jgi:IS30 family transposase
LVKGRTRPRLSPLEREEINIGAAGGESQRSIAHRLDRAASTIMREIDRNGRCRGATGRYRARHRFGADRGGWDAKSGYRASIAQARSEERARRPKAGKLDRNRELREVVEDLLGKKYSPEQIAGLMPKLFPDRPEMRVSHETIYKHVYKALYVQGRGELRRGLSACLRTGRAVRKPRKRTSATEARGRIPGMVNISERPPEVGDRAVPGHWEGDLIIGKNSSSQIGTLVERSTGFVQLLHLPESRPPIGCGRRNDQGHQSPAR